MMQRYTDIENEYGKLFHMINSLVFLPALSYLFLQAMISFSRYKRSLGNNYVSDIHIFCNSCNSVLEGMASLRVKPNLDHFAINFG